MNSPGSQCSLNKQTIVSFNSLTLLFQNNFNNFKSHMPYDHVEYN